MTINILAFGIAKEILGKSENKFEVQEGIKVKMLRSFLIERFPKMKSLASFLIAIDGEYATEDLVINPEQEIAVIPPVSGG